MEVSVGPNGGVLYTGDHLIAAVGHINSVIREAQDRAASGDFQDSQPAYDNDVDCSCNHQGRKKGVTILTHQRAQVSAVNMFENGVVTAASITTTNTVVMMKAGKVLGIKQKVVSDDWKIGM